MDPIISCPFRVGDLVRFVPSVRTRGLYPHIEGFGIALDQELRIATIKEGTYLYFEDGIGGWPWNEFELAAGGVKR